MTEKLVKAGDKILIELTVPESYGESSSDEVLPELVVEDWLAFGHYDKGAWKYRILLSELLNNIIFNILLL